MRNDQRRACLFAALFALAGCGGQSLIRDAQPLPPTPSLAVANDERIQVTLEAVVVRNGNGAWVTHADWDEYLLRVKASGESVQIKEVAIFDALGTRIASRTERTELVEGTRETEQRYSSSDKLVKSAGGGWMVVGGVGAAVVGAGVLYGAAPAIALSAMGAGAGAGAALAVFPILLVGGGIYAGAGVARMITNSKINDEIQRRQTPLPMAVARGEEKRIVHFFPLTPLPSRVEVVYADAQGEHRFQIDTREKLAKLHAEPAPQLISRAEPNFPVAAMRDGIEGGFVKARLNLTRTGSVDKVEILQSQPPGVFNREATATFRFWRYSESSFGDRTVEATLEFKR